MVQEYTQYIGRVIYLVCTRLFFNSLSPWWYDSNFKCIIFKHIIHNSSLSTHCKIATEYHQWAVNIGSGYGLVPSGITWTDVDPDLCCNMALLGRYESTSQFTNIFKFTS